MARDKVQSGMILCIVLEQRETFEIAHSYTQEATVTVDMAWMRESVAAYHSLNLMVKTIT